MHPSDPLYTQQLHFGLIGNIETIWDEYSGAGIHVGVYDTGIDPPMPTSPTTTTRAVVWSSVGHCSTGCQTRRRRMCTERQSLA